MQMNRRAGMVVSALAAAAVIAPVGLNGPTPAAAATQAKKAPAVAAADGFHSKKGTKSCGRGKTAHVFVTAIGWTRLSWRVPGGKLHSARYAFDPSGMATHPLPTWHRKVQWKVTSDWGQGKKNLFKVYAYCSKDGGEKRSGRSTKVMARKSGTKSCARGKQVVIRSWGMGWVRHKFRSTKPGSKVYTHDLARQGYLMDTRLTPTGMRKVKWVAKAHEGVYHNGGKLREMNLYCGKL
ncbi:hypothetical protein [Streptomyces sp. NPDC021622]|uniref:hypothetical protein n=1 Tax=Streptomyces sp. NPDC021622 TaxID=3155013 RepID=UPI0033EBE734